MVCYASLFAIASGRSLARRRAAGRIEVASHGLVGLIGGQALAPTERAALDRLPVQVRMRLIADQATNIGGESGIRLSQLAVETGVVSEAERLCESRRPARRLRGLRVLTRVGARSDAPPALMDDPSYEVRAAAATWATDHPSPELNARLVAMLSDPEPLCRFAAKDALLRIGRPVVGPLAERLRVGGDGHLDDALEVGVGLADASLLPIALGLDGSPGTRVRGAELAAAVGGADAIDALERMLADDDAEVRAAAAAGLGRLQHWPAAAALAGALNDPSWDVRRAAGLALARLGAPGRLLLREALGHSDRFARDMARQVLDLPRSRSEKAPA